MPRTDARLRLESHTLTLRQREVLELIARGKTNPQIAEALGITLDGAKWHVSSIMERLGVDSREEAAAAWKAERHRVAHIARAVRALIPAILWTKSAAIAASVIAVSAISAGVIISAGVGSSSRVATHSLSTAATATATSGPNTASANGITVHVVDIQADVTETSITVDFSGASGNIQRTLLAGRLPTLRDAEGHQYFVSSGHEDPTNPERITFGFPPLPDGASGLILDLSGAAGVAGPLPQKFQIPLTWTGTSAGVAVQVDTSAQQIASHVTISLDRVVAGDGALHIEGHVSGISSEQIPESSISATLTTSDGASPNFDSMRAGYGADRGSFDVGFKGLVSGPAVFTLAIGVDRSPHDSVAGASLDALLANATPATWHISIPAAVP